MQTNTNHYMMILGKSKVPDLLNSGFKVSYKNEGFLSSQMRVAMHKNGMHMTAEQREKLINDFKIAIESHGNLGNPKLTKILKKDGNIPNIGSGGLAARTLYTYIGLARCRLGLDSKSPEPQRGDRSGKNYSKEDIAKAVDMYVNKKNSIRDVAGKMNWSKSKTRHILTTMAKVKMRSKSEGRLLSEAKINREKSTSVGVK